MNLPDWIKAMLFGISSVRVDPAKALLNRRQIQVADRLAEMKGITRDEVMAEAYRRADRIVARKGH